MNNHKPVTIFIFAFLKHDKNAISFMKIYMKTFRIWPYARKAKYFFCFFK